MTLQLKSFTSVLSYYGRTKMNAHRVEKLLTKDSTWEKFRTLVFVLQMTNYW